MTNIVDYQRVKRIVRRVKGAIKVRDTIKEHDINMWVSVYSSLISDIVYLKENECNVYDYPLIDAICKALKEDSEISPEDYEYFVDYIHVRRNRDCSYISHESG